MCVNCSEARAKRDGGTSSCPSHARPHLHFSLHLLGEREPQLGRFVLITFHEERAGGRGGEREGRSAARGRVYWRPRPMTCRSRWRGACRCGRGGGGAGPRRVNGRASCSLPEEEESMQGRLVAGGGNRGCASQLIGINSLLNVIDSPH